MATSVTSTPPPPPPDDEEQAAEIALRGIALDMFTPPVMTFNAEPMDALKEGEDEEDFLSPPPIPLQG